MTSMDTSQWPTLYARSMGSAKQTEKGNEYFWLFDKENEGKDENDLFHDLESKVRNKARETIQQVSEHCSSYTNTALVSLSS